MIKTGIKISRSTTDITSTDFRDLLMHSDFSMFKFHSDDTYPMVISPTDTTKTITIPHGLGYVPMFMSYFGGSEGTFLLPLRVASFSCSLDRHIFSYADSTNIYITLKNNDIPFGAEDYYASDYWNTQYNDNLDFSVGRIANNQFDGAFRFTSINLLGSDTLYSAKIYIGTDDKGGSGDIKFRTWGIDEDNTGSFSSGPMSRTKTTAETSTTRSVPTNIGDTVEVDVVNQVNEIKSRGGWLTNNSLGFIMNENSGASDAWLRSGPYGYGTYLRIIKNGNTTFNFRVIVFKDKISD